MSTWFRREFLRSVVLGGGWALGRPGVSDGAPREPLTVERPRSWFFAGNGALNLQDYGALGDGANNDGPALQAALNALSAAGGGTLLVPPGRYAIKTPVARNFLNTASAIIIEGAGSASQFLIQTGGGTTAIALHNLESLVFDDLTFVGTPGVFTDADTTLMLSGCMQAVLRRVDFYGISTLAQAGGVVWANRSDLRIQTSAFRGCTANSGVGGAVVQNTDWRGLSITETDFIDFGVLNGVFHSKTPFAPALAWIALWNTTPVDETTDQNTVVCRGIRMDEGAFFGIACLPNSAVSGRVASILLSDLRHNVSGVSGSVGCYIQHVDNVRIEHSFFGYTTNLREAIHLRGVNEAVISDVRCEAGANLIVAETSVKAVHVRESRYGQLRSDAESTLVTHAGLDAWLLKADGPIPAQSLVVQSPATDQRVVVAPAGAAASSIVGVALDTTSKAGDYVRVLRFPGFAVVLKSDGAGSIARGAAVAPSPTQAGRVRAVASGPHIGRSLTTVGASVSATPRVVFTWAQ